MVTKKDGKIIELDEIVVTARRRTPAEQKRHDKKQIRKKKRLDIKEINTQATIDRLQKKLETIEQKRDPYSHGGVAKPN
jgi:hypothetical protein